jgi:hypothetical protein
VRSILQLGSICRMTRCVIEVCPGSSVSSQDNRSAFGEF